MFTQELESEEPCFSSLILSLLEKKPEQQLCVGYGCNIVIAEHENL